MSDVLESKREAIAEIGASQWCASSTCLAQPFGMILMTAKAM